MLYPCIFLTLLLAKRRWDSQGNAHVTQMLLQKLDNPYALMENAIYVSWKAAILTSYLGKPIKVHESMPPHLCDISKSQS